jgi:hypothetical protein
MQRAGDLLYRKRVTALKRAVERLPDYSRRAMLQGLGEDTIIAGAYSVGPARCPGFAAYRRGARTGYSEFAAAWDRYARGRGVRRVKGDDVATLVGMLRASLPTEARLDLAAPASTNGHGAASTNGHGAVSTNRNGAPSANGNCGAPAEPTVPTETA